MRRRTFLIVFVLSLLFFFGANLLEKGLKDLFYLQEINKNPQFFSAQASLINLNPVRIRSVENPQINSEAAVSIFLNDKGEEKVLFEENGGQELYVASLTKLMTALVVLENYDLEKEISISQEAVDQEEDFGKLKAGKSFPAGYLLYPLLMESSNDAAFALANDYEGMNEKKFIELMNLKARELNLENTYFFNSSGLEPDVKNPEINHSTARDLAKLTEHLLKEPEFSKIWDILSTLSYSFFGPELINTNELLEEIPNVVGGKTGYAEKAGGCMLLVVKAPKNRGYLINIILGTPDPGSRFDEMRKLVGWTKTSYKW